jgi:hypothetical protein
MGPQKWFVFNLSRCENRAGGNENLGFFVYFGLTNAGWSVFCVVYRGALGDEGAAMNPRHTHVWTRRQITTTLGQREISARVTFQAPGWRTLGLGSGLRGSGGRVYRKPEKTAARGRWTCHNGSLYYSPGIVGTICIMKWLKIYCSLRCTSRTFQVYNFTKINKEINKRKKK